MERRDPVSAMDEVASSAAPTGPEGARRPRALSARAIILAYVVVAVLWIALSDQVVGPRSRPDDRILVGTVKGAGSVAVTAGLLAGLLRRYDALRAHQAAELERRERRYRLLTEHAQDIIFRLELGPTAATEYLSPATERVLGYPPSAFDADPDLFRRLVHPDDRALVDPDAGPWRDGRPAVVRMKHADGRWVWLEQRATPLLDAAGRTVAVEGVARDVTEQRRVEAAPRVSRVQMTLSANRALVRADQEIPRGDLAGVVDEGGFRFARGLLRGRRGGHHPPGRTRGTRTASRRDRGQLERRRSWSRAHGTLRASDACRQQRPHRSGNGPWADAARSRGYASSADPLGAATSSSASSRSTRPTDAFARRLLRFRSWQPTSPTGWMPCGRGPPARRPRLSASGWRWPSSSPPSRWSSRTPRAASNT
jgi:PAS domain S-box-containing protein